MAKIVVIEGPDKVGKETQSKKLVHALNQYGVKTKLVEMPVRDCNQSYRLIYWMLRNGRAKQFPNVFQFVQFVNKWLFQRIFLKKLHEEYDVLVFDRWALSSVIYGNATNVNKKFVMFLFNLLMKPDLTFVFHGLSFRRSTTEDDSYEKDTDLQAEVKQAYAKWANEYHYDHILVKNDKSIQEIHAFIMSCVAARGII